MLLHDEQAGFVAEGDSVFFEGEDDAASQLAKDGIFLVGSDADVDGVDDFASIDFIDAEDDGFVDGNLSEGGIVANFGGERFEEGYDLVGICAGIDADGKRGDGEVSGEIGYGSNLAVGDDVDGSVGVAERGAAEG